MILNELCNQFLHQHFNNSFAFFSQKGFKIYKIMQKLNIFARNQEMFATLLSSCSRYNIN
jgi:hypothetical protein